MLSIDVFGSSDRLLFADMERDRLKVQIYRLLEHSYNCSGHFETNITHKKKSNLLLSTTVWQFIAGNAFATAVPHDQWNVATLWFQKHRARQHSCPLRLLAPGPTRTRSVVESRFNALCGMYVLLFYRYSELHAASPLRHRNALWGITQNADRYGSFHIYRCRVGLNRSKKLYVHA